MAHTPTTAAMPLSLTHLVIPADQFAAAIRLAFDTLVALINDKKAHARERRLAAVAIFRLASPPAPPPTNPERQRRASAPVRPRAHPARPRRRT